MSNQVVAGYRVVTIERIVAIVLMRAVGDGYLLDDPVLGDDDVIRGRCLVGGRTYTYGVELNSYAVTLKEAGDARVAS